MREIKVEEALRKAVEAEGGLCLKFRSPGNDGVPDRICLFPGGRVAFVETKRPGEHVEPGGLQEDWLHTLQDMGFEAVEINTPEKARGWAACAGARIAMAATDWVRRHFQFVKDGGEQ